MSQRMAHSTILQLLYQRTSTRERLVGVDAQGKLITNVASMRLKPGSSLVALHRFCNLMFEQWSLIPPNGNQNLISYWDQLMLALPTQPVASHLTTARTWLAGHVEGFRNGTGALCSNVDAAIAALVIHARAIGLPARVGAMRSATGSPAPSRPMPKSLKARDTSLKIVVPH